MIGRDDLRWLDQLRIQSPRQDIDERVDRLFIDRTLETHNHLISKRQQRRPPKPQKKLPIAKLAFSLTSLALIIAMIMSVLPIFYGGDFDISVSVEPTNPVEGDLIYLNATIPTSYNITAAWANISGRERITLKLLNTTDNVTTDQLWQGNWLFQNFSAGDHLITLSAIDRNQTVYQTTYRWTITSNETQNETTQPDDNQTQDDTTPPVDHTNDTKPPTNDSSEPVGPSNYTDKTRVIVKFTEKTLGKTSLGVQTDWLEDLGLITTAEIKSAGLVAGFINTSLIDILENYSDIEGIYSDRSFNVLLLESLPLIRFNDSIKDFNLTGNGTTICILDTGVDSSLVNYSYGYDFVNDDSIPDDEHGHGTQVAAVIKAMAPETELIVAKVLGANGTGYESDVLEGLQWCMDQHPDIISFSIGSQATCTGFCDADFVADLANSATEQGIFVIAAAGNDGSTNLTSPACGSQVFSVGATDDTDTIASFSNVNPTLDLFAPGVDITTIAGTSSGTSMSAPHVAAASALVVEAEFLPPADLKYRLRSTGTPIKYTYNESLTIDIGRLDLYNALTNTKTMEPYNYSHWLQDNISEGGEYESLADAWLGINSSEYDSDSGDDGSHTASEALDGTDYWGVGFKTQHWLILDLGETYTIKKVRARSNLTADPTDVDIYVSDSKASWGTAVATGINTWQDNSSWQEVDTTDKDGRYINISITATEIAGGGGTWALSFGGNPAFTIFDAYGSTSLSVENVTITATHNFTLDDLIGSGDIYSGQEENSTFEWWTNESGSWAALGVNSTTLDSNYTNESAWYKFEYTPGNGTAYGDPVNSSAFQVKPLSEAAGTYSGAYDEAENLTIANGGNLTISGTIDIDGDVLVQNGGTLSLGSSNQYLGSLTVNAGGSCTGSSGTLFITSETSGGYAVDLDGTYTHNSGILEINTDDNTWIDPSGAGNPDHFNNVIIDLVSTTDDVFLSASFPTDGFLTIDDGELNTNNNAVTINEDVLIQSGGEFDGEGDTADHSFGALDIEMGGVFRGAANSKITITDETVAGYAVEIEGTYTANANTIEIQTPSSTKVDFMAPLSLNTVYDIIIDTGDVVEWVGATTISNSLTIEGGSTFQPDTNTYSLSVAGDVTLLESGTLSADRGGAAWSFGSLTTTDTTETVDATSGTTTITSYNTKTKYVVDLDGTYTHNSGTLRFTLGDKVEVKADLIPFKSFVYDLTIDIGDTTVVSWEGSTTINHDLTVNSGTFSPDASESSLTVNGDVSVTGGIFGRNDIEITAGWQFLSLSQTGGTIQAPASTISIRGKTSGLPSYAVDLDGTFAHNAGIIEINTDSTAAYLDLQPSSGTVNDIIIALSDTSYDIYLATSCTISGSCKIDECELDTNNKALTVTSELLVLSGGVFDGAGDTFDHSFGALDVDSGGTFTGSSSSTIIITGESSGYAVDLDGIYTANSNTLEIRTNANTEADLIPSVGTVYDLVINTQGNDYLVDWGGATTISNDLTITNGVFRPNIAGDTLTVSNDASLSGSGSTLGLDSASGAWSFGSLTQEASTTILATSGTITITDEASSGYAIDLDGTYTHNSGTLEIERGGVEDSTIIDIAPSSGTIYDLVIDTLGNTVTSDELATIANNVTVDAGSFDVTANLSINGMNIDEGTTFNIKENSTLTMSGVLTLNGDFDIINGSAVEVTLNSTTFDLTDGINVSLHTLPIIPANPSGLGNISKYVNVTAIDASATVDINISYDDADLGSIMEDTLVMYEYNETTGLWVQAPNTGADTSTNHVWATDVTNFSIYGPMGRINIAPEISNPYPPNESTNIPLRPSMNITVNDGNGHTMNVTWYSNSTGPGDLILRPNANGTTTNLNKNGDNANYKCVDEETHDGSSTHVSRSAGSWANDTYNITDHGLASDEQGVINFVNVYIVACRDNNFGMPPTDSYTKIILCNGTHYNESDQFTIAQGMSPLPWTSYNRSWATNPFTGSSWTWNDIDTIEAGVAFVGNQGLSRCTQLYVVVNYTAPAWLPFGRNNSVGNGTYHQTNANFSAYDTTYWWYVNASDGYTTNMSDIFHFTILQDNAPEFSNENPVNGSVNVSLYPTVNITINDDESDPLNISFHTNQSGSWSSFGSIVKEGTSDFGYTWAQGSTKEDTNDMIRGTWFTCPTNGTAAGITARVYVTGGQFDSAKMNCALYYKSNLSLIANTTEVTFGSMLGPNHDGWKEFTFDSPPVLAAGEEYYVVIHGDLLSAYNVKVYNASTPYSNRSISMSQAYGSFPAELTPTYIGNKMYEIYVEYTPDSVANGTYYMDYLNTTSPNATYYWNVSADDGNLTNTSDLFHFTTESENTTITVTPDQWAMGTIDVGGSNETTGFYFTLTNNGNCYVDIQIKGEDATNETEGTTWKLTPTPGHDNFSMQYNLSSEGTWTTINTSFEPFLADLAIDDSQTFDLKFIAATTSSTTTPMSLSLTFKSVVS